MALASPMASTRVASTSRMASCRPVQVFRAASAAPQVRRGLVRMAAAYIPEWPNPEFIAEVSTMFPEEAIATVEQARVLFSELGYTYLDVRPTLECDEAGKVKGSVNVPFKNAKWVYNAEERKKTVQYSDNPEFINMIRKKFPKTDTKLLVGCSNGRAYSMDALGALDEAGYTNLVGLKGGFYAWFSVFDNKLARRRSGEYQENYMHDGDSCGIHSSGAGFEKMDPAEPWVPRF